MSGLLVSVRDAAEAMAAVAGGASLIDVKEPLRGALGRADDATVIAVLNVVGGRFPVSAAMGEVMHAAPPVATPRLTFVKWGFAGAGSADWRRAVPALIGWAAPAAFVPCAYADWADAAAPPVEDLLAAAIEFRLPALLIDTAMKDGRTLPDLMDAATLGRIAERCRDAGVKLALAGSLTAIAIDKLRPLRPDWFAVRGAACDGGRTGRISVTRVRALAEAVG